MGVVLGLYQSRAKQAGSVLPGVESARPESARVDLVSWLVQRVAHYPMAAMDASAGWVEDSMLGIVAAPSLNRRVRELESSLATYRSERGSIDRLEQAIEEARALAGLPNYPTYKKVPADIIGYFPEARRILLPVGADRMIRPGAPVISARGLVGQVVEVSPDTCYVNLTTHTDFSVGARVTRDTPQEAGIAKGQASPHMLLSVYTEGAQVEVGDVVTTSGLSTIYPEGVLIGLVTEVWTNRSLGLREASVLPAVQAGSLRSVVVLVR